MSAALVSVVVVRDDMDWAGFAVVMGILLLVVLAIAPVTRDWWRREGDIFERLIDEAFDPVTGPQIWTAPELDHVECANPDCDQTICCCAVRCPDTVELGCTHTGEPVCEDDRLSGCPVCHLDAAADRDDAWAAGR